MSIERSRNRLRSTGAVAPRPDGISRRVATAARDRQLGPLPEQRPTGWHRLVFDNPPRPVSASAVEAPSADPTARPVEDPADSPARPDAPIRPDHPTVAEAAPMGAADGAGSATTHRRTEPPRRQVGRVTEARPHRSRRWAAVLIAAVGAAAVAGVATVLMVSTQSDPSAPGPGPGVISTPSPVLTSAPAPTDSPTAAPTPAVADVPAPSSVVPAVPTEPAVVSTLSPGDPGFGWPSTAFGSAPAGG